ncbi:MAG: DegT/DnrJ/EryC1/StrS family aminotransferase [Bacteroidota bacterium]|nr:DegT/DnrJ/EryC1/StrS family aminotransferase [Bacteroidota bacterium]
MVDLARQHAGIREDIEMAFIDVFDSSAFIKGPYVNKFENGLAEFLDINHVIGVANGTDALQLAIMALDLPDGSEIITPDFTFVSTAEVVRLMGHIPVLVDVDADTFNILPSAIEEAITENTRAIIPVHLFGQCCDMDAITQIAGKYGLFIIEDNAQSLGADYTFSNGKRQKAGTIGHIGCTSFFPSKNLGCMGDGGALFTNDATLADKIKTFANHGMGNQYEYETIGINSRLDGIQAAWLSVKLKHYTGYIGDRNNLADFYDELFANMQGIQIPVRSANSTHIFHQYTLKVLDGERDQISKYLNDAGIPNKVYYPNPIHNSKPYHDHSIFHIDRLTNSLALSKQVLSMPMHTEMDDEQMEYIKKTVEQYKAQKQSK